MTAAEMDDERLPWFPCYPQRLLNALAGLGPDEGYLYVIVLLRIYEVNGPCPDPVSVLALRTHMTVRRTERALATLVGLKKLTETDDGLVNGVAVGVLSKQQVVRKRRSQSAKAAAEKRWGKTKVNQRNGDASRMAKHAEIEIESEIDKKEESSGGVTRPPPATKATKGTRIPHDFSLTAERLAYAVEWGFTEREAKFKMEKFVGYYRTAPGQKGVWLNWNLVWQGWVRRDAERLGRLEPVSNGHAPAAVDPRKFTKAQWVQVLKLWKSTNNWNQKYGPEPGANGCLVPPELFLQPRLV